MCVSDKTDSKSKYAKELKLWLCCRNRLFCSGIFDASRFCYLMLCPLEQLKLSSGTNSAPANRFYTKHRKQNHML